MKKFKETGRGGRVFVKKLPHPFRKSLWEVPQNPFTNSQKFSYFRFVFTDSFYQIQLPSYKYFKLHTDFMDTPYTYYFKRTHSTDI